MTRPEIPWWALSGWIAAAGFLYGAVMGSGGGGAVPLQALYSGLKVPLLLVIASLICLPSFFVLNTTLGLREDFSAACRGLLSSQATIALCLASLAPVTLLGYCSSNDYPFAKLMNGTMFAIASIAGQVTLARHYQPLIARNRRHRVGLLSWLLLYIFVAIQFAWTLRPFIGNPAQSTSFFRSGAFSNAYVEVASTVLSVLGG